MNIKEVTNVLFIKDNQVLLGLKKRGFGVNKYNGFGGKLQANETIREAAIREAIEESGLKPLDLEKVGVIDFPDSYPLRMHLYISKKWEGEPLESDEMKPQWFDFNAIPYQQMWEDDVYWLDHVLAGKKIRASFIFEHASDLDGTASNHVVMHSIEEVTGFDE